MDLSEEDEFTDFQSSETSASNPTDLGISTSESTETSLNIESPSSLNLEPTRMTSEGTTTRNITAPLRGGIDISDDPVAWTGGDPRQRDRVMASDLCMRPTQRKELASIRTEASTGLAATHHLGAPSQAGNKITFATWMRYVTRHLRHCGLDSLFYVPKKGTTEPKHFICTDWGAIAMDDVDAFLDTLDSDKYDKQNLQWAGQFLQNSITLELWGMIEPELGLNVDGLRILTAIILQYQSSACITIRNLTTRLLDLTLTKVPGENVEVLCQSIYDIASQIEGLGEAPRDLASLVAGRFLKSSSQAFSSEAMNIYQRSKSATNPITWTVVLRELKTVYNQLKGEGLWDAVEPPKTETDSALAAIQRDIAELKRRGKTDREPGKSNNGSDKEKSSGEREKTIFQLTPPPKDGEPTVKIIDGKECTYCSKCGWTYDRKRHSTEEHKTAAELKAIRKAKQSSESAKTANDSSQVDDKDDTGTLAMSSGFLLSSFDRLSTGTDF